MWKHVYQHGLISWKFQIFDNWLFRSFGRALNGLAINILDNGEFVSRSNSFCEHWSQFQKVNTVYWRNWADGIWWQSWYLLVSTNMYGLVHSSLPEPVTAFNREAIDNRGKYTQRKAFLLSTIVHFQMLLFWFLIIAIEIEDSSV